MTALTHALSSVDAYVDFFSRQPWPVLRRTAGELAHLEEDLDNVTRMNLAAVVLSDPLMTMRLLSHIEKHRQAKQNHDIVNIASALVMMGIMPFFKAFSALPTVEDELAPCPWALLGLLKVVSRACRAAHFAREWAVIRRDLDVNEITVAALLREAFEMVCWLHAPELTQRVYIMQRADRSLRSATAQREVFGVTAREMQLALIRVWHLPELLVNLLDESQAEQPRVRTVTLASDFARHLSLGWDNPALPNDVACLNALLRIPPEALMHRIGAPEEMWPKLLPGTHAAASPATTQ
ncbi:MAG: HDOD domain-containing protein [Azoarcus sp.]|jgi:hypothetical protein|nr:HDOD domain-containing protein [Azoarcus sp.]